MDVTVPDNIKALQSSVIARLKIMAHLDIAERRLPQDGRINLQFEGGAIDVRVATVPTVEGESVSLRLLNQEKFTISKLQLEPFVDSKIRQLLKLANGIVLITGPTGSGKSTSLYSFLSEVNSADTRIVTIEDPVENKLPGVMQIAVKSEIGLTFASGLRSILRAEHQRRDGRDQPADRHGGGAVPALRLGAGIPRPASGAAALPGLQGTPRADRPPARGDGDPGLHHGAVL